MRLFSLFYFLSFGFLLRFWFNFFCMILLKRWKNKTLNGLYSYEKSRELSFLRGAAAVGIIEMTSERKAESQEWQIILNGGTAKNWIDLAKAVGEMLLEKDAVIRINEVSTIYERAVRALPFSYKMWTSYISYRITNLQNEYVCNSQDCFQCVRLLFERAVEKLPKMPLLWESYLEWVINGPLPPRITMARLIFAQSLQSLPSTQHHYIWEKLKVWTTRTLTLPEENVPAVIPLVPTPTFRILWRTFFYFDHSFRERVHYFTILFNRGNMNDLVNEWVEFFYEHYCSRTESVKDENDTDPEVMLLHRPHIWLLFERSLKVKGWKFYFLEKEGSSARKIKEGEKLKTDVKWVDRINTVVDYGAQFVDTPVDFLLVYSLFLYGQGQCSEGRKRVRQLLEEATDPITFHSVYKVAVEVEDELVESFAQHPRLLHLSSSDSESVIERLFGPEANGDALFQLSQLMQKHDTLLNQAQLRNLPKSVPLWLKRVELFLESAIEKNETTLDDIIKLWYQAIKRCTQGGGRVDISVAQLYESFAFFLLDHDRVSEAKSILEEGAWSTAFLSSSVNADLLGVLTEIQLLTTPFSLEKSSNSALVSIGDEIIQKLHLASSFSSSLVQRKRHRSGLLLGLSSPQTLGLSPLKMSSLAWILAFDIIRTYTGSEHQHLEVVIDHIFSTTTSPRGGSKTVSSAYTPEVCAYIGFQMYKLGEVKLAMREFERGIAYFTRNALGVLFLVSQYISFLLFHYGSTLLLDTFRELCQTVISVTPSTLLLAPHFTVEVLMSCVAVESTYGLYSTALAMAKNTVQLAIRYLFDIHEHRENFLLVCGAIEQTISLAFFFKGIPEVRTLCSELLRMVASHPKLIQRICIHWASLEKRCGLQMNAHTILNTYAETQNPDTPSGSIYWQLWSELCGTLNEFEVFVRRRQQSRVTHEKQAKN